MEAVYIILICFAASIVPFGIIFVFVSTQQIFKNTMYRSPKKPRTRSCSDSSIAEHKHMFELGTAWAEGHRDKIEEVHIVNDGLNLYGQYINLNNDKCAFIVQGRTESLLYSYYYADVYAKNGYNILVIDTRAHGLSDGKYVTAGVKEYEDIIVWIDLIKQRYGIESFLLHGVCIGAASAIYAYCATKGDSPIKKIVTDGLYTNYYEMFRNHIINFNKPVLFFIYLTFFYARVVTGGDVLNKTPYKHMKDVDLPILFLWSDKDVFATPDKSLELFEACASKQKEMRFFPKGNHSYVRYYNTEEYDRTIEEFINRE